MADNNEEQEERFEQADDVEQMFNSFRGSPDEEEQPDEGSTPEEPTGEQEGEEEAGGGEEEGSVEGEEETEQEETSEEASEKAGKEAGEEEEEASDVPEAEALRKTIERMSSEHEESGEEETGEEESEEASAEEETDTSKSPFEVSDEEFSEMMQDKSKFVSFLNKFGDVVRQQAREDTLRDIPNVVSKTTQRQQTLLEKKNQFFNNNPDLKEHSNYVGYTATRLYSQNPELSVDDLFNKTAEQVRKDLALNKRAVEAEDTRMKKTAEQRSKPAFASSKTGGTRSHTKDNRNEMQKDLDAMIESTQ